MDTPYDGPFWLFVSKRGSHPPPERTAEMKGLSVAPPPSPWPLFSEWNQGIGLKRDGTVRWNTGSDFVF